MRNLFTNACIALCCLTCIEHHGEVCGMQPFVNKVVTASGGKDSLRRSDVKISFSQKDQQEHEAFFERLDREGRLECMDPEESSRKPIVYTLRFDVFQDALRQESADFQERLGNMANGDTMRFIGYPIVYYRLADYGIFHMTGKVDNIRRLYSLMMALPHVTMPNGDVHIRRDDFGLLNDPEGEFTSILRHVKPKNYVVFSDAEAIYID